LVKILLRECLLVIRELLLWLVMIDILLRMFAIDFLLWRVAEVLYIIMVIMSIWRRLGLIIDVIVDNTGLIKSLILEEKKGKRFSREEYELDWSQIAKIGDDIILAKDKV
jgi:sporulation protein YlmC with PRC-barrel domain